MLDSEEILPAQECPYGLRKKVRNKPLMTVNAAHQVI